VVHPVLENGKNFFSGQLQVCGSQGQCILAHTQGNGGEQVVQGDGVEWF
jgi:hypothetical protein